MSSSLYEVGQHHEKVWTDPETNVRYDERGNPVIYHDQNYSGNMPAYYTENRQPLKYAEVFPGPVNVHQNVPLSDFAIAFEIDAGIFISPVISPVKTVKKRSDLFYKISRAEVTRDDRKSDIRVVGGVANEIQQSFDTDNYQVVDHAYRDFLPDEVADNADEVLQLMSSITTFLTTVLEFNWDRRTIEDLFTTVNFSDATFASTNPESEQITDATPTKRHIHGAFNAGNIQIVRNNVMMGATHVVMNADVAQQIAQSPEIADVVKHQRGVDYVIEGGWAGENFSLPNILYGKRVVVMPHVNNTAKKKKTPVFVDLLDDKLIFLHVAPPSRRTRNAGTVFRKGGLIVRTYRDEPRKGTFIEVEMIQDEKLTNAFAGHILTDALPA